MKILQISAPKSGSYWLHSILHHALQKSSRETKSFIKQQPQYPRLKQRELSFKGQAGVDMMDIEEDACYYRVSSILREPIENLQEYVDSTSLVWTHSTLCKRSFEVFPLFDKKVCIIRDPRDRALSSARFAFTPYMQQHYPTSYSSPECYLEGEFNRLMEQWEWFVGNYLLQKEVLDIYFIFYERLLNDFETEFENLLNYLELPLQEADRKNIARAVTFSSMKDRSPGHLQKGKYGKWVRQLSEYQKAMAVDKSGTLLNILHYPISQEDAGMLPAIPKEIPQKQILQSLKEIQWQDLYV